MLDQSRFADLPCASDHNCRPGEYGTLISSDISLLIHIFINYTVLLDKFNSKICMPIKRFLL